MWAIPTGASWLFKKKKNQVKSPSPESRVPELGSDPPIGSGRDSGRDIGWCLVMVLRMLWYCASICFSSIKIWDTFAFI